MLGVFRADLKKLALPPEMPGKDCVPAMRENNLEGFFIANFKYPVLATLGNYGLLAYSADLDISPKPGPLFCVKGGISCIYRGGTRIMRKGKKVEERGNVAEDLITCYKDLQGKGYHTPFQKMEVPPGDYNYILYDNSPGRECAFAVNYSEDLPVYYGFDSIGFCVIADNPLVMMEVCGESFTAIPIGNGILIPVIAELKIEPIEVDALGVNYQMKCAEIATKVNLSGGTRSSVVDASKGESIKGKSSSGSTPKKTNRGKAVEGSPSGGSIIIKESGGEAAAASPSGGSSLKIGSGGKRSGASPTGGGIVIKESGGEAAAASPSGGSSVKIVSGGKRSGASPSDDSSSKKGRGSKTSK